MLSTYTLNNLVPGIFDKISLRLSLSNLSKAAYEMSDWENPEIEDTLHSFIDGLEDAQSEIDDELKRSIDNGFYDALRYPKDEIDKFLGSDEFLDFVVEYHKTGWDYDSVIDDILYDEELKAEIPPVKSNRETLDFLVSERHISQETADAVRDRV
jgi:hypothetical protein